MSTVVYSLFEKASTFERVLVADKAYHFLMASAEVVVESNNSNCYAFITVPHPTEGFNVSVMVLNVYTKELHPSDATWMDDSITHPDYNSSVKYIKGNEFILKALLE